MAVVAGLVLGSATLREWAWAQEAGGASGGGGTMSLTAAVLLVSAEVMALVGVVAILELRRQRGVEAVALRAHVSDVLLRDGSLSSLPITVTVRVPIRRAAPALAEVHGEVPAPELRDAVLRVVDHELKARRPDVRVEDRIMVLPPVGAYAA